VREREVEQRLSAAVRQAGGQTYKWVSPGRSGVPDRLCLLPAGRVAAVEVKRPGGQCTALQKKLHEELRGLGLPVFVVSDDEGIANMMQELSA